MTETLCEGCETPIAQPRFGRRKWCSDRCRKATLYGGTCIDCGARTDGSNGPGGAPERCIVCAGRARVVWTREAILAAIRQWAEQHGQPPAATDWNATLARYFYRPERPAEYPSVDTVQREFGSWNAGIAAAGFDPTPVGHRPKA